ncbi:uncharacterized protein LOC111070625 [Drosophila obscura]|uniref:uncharacterized protein LOC111070625 n=1 Tax=Drosophila obscura TaxID=7282 RepID=UPI001BB1B160|nr:uncharacterized protein LOC111070625 [Drosophila obscura]
MPTARRCVICGMEPRREVDAKGNERYTYPKTAQEARIWQQSMGAKDVCVESIQQQCCVCVEHIPDFVQRSKRISKKQRAAERAEEVRRRKHGEATTDACECPNMDPPRCPAVNVLVINGASLPSYCGKGQSCLEIKAEEAGEEDGDVRRSLTKRFNPDDSDTEIFVQESEFQDIGATFPDIDGTEVTVLRTPVQEDEQIQKVRKRSTTDSNGKETTEGCVDRQPTCMPGCTDVLVLARGSHPTDVCPCKCDQCTKQPTAGLKDEDECCNPPCCPETQEHFDQPPCGCECEQQVRRVLGKVIKTQKQRISELETMLCKQNNLHTALQRKVDELYCEFGRLDDDDRVRLECCARGRGPPDCSLVKSTGTGMAAPMRRPRDPNKPRRPEHLNTKDSLPEEIPINEEAPRADLPAPQPVQLFSEKNSKKKPEKTEKPTKTRRPGWLCFGRSSETDKATENKS